MIRTARSAPARALEQARHRILEHVDRAAPVQEMPVGWPMTRHHVRMVVRDLSREGLVSLRRAPGSRLPVLTLTPAGRHALDSLPAEDS